MACFAAAGVASGCIGGAADGATAVPGSAVGACAIGSMPRLSARAHGPRLAQHGRGQGGAPENYRGFAVVLARQPHAIHRLGAGGNILGCDLGLVGIGGKQAGDPGDRGIVAAGESLARG
jgi:hypothetical protein